MKTLVSCFMYLHTFVYKPCVVVGQAGRCSCVKDTISRRYESTTLGKVVGQVSVECDEL